MDELIKQLTSQLGIDESIANAATSKAAALVKEHAGDDLFSQLAGSVPGLQQAAEQPAADSEPAGGGGMFGKLASMASDAIGGDAGGGLELGAALTSAGLDSGQIGGFVKMLLDFLRDKAGDAVMDQVLAKFPMLKQLLG